MLIRKPKILCGEAAEDNNREQWELLGGQPLFGGTHRLQSHAENGAIFRPFLICDGFSGWVSQKKSQNLLT